MRDCKALRRTRIDLEHGVLDDVAAALAEALIGTI
jgi:hypothetical protein